jgi:hypothetical protein
MKTFVGTIAALLMLAPVGGALASGDSKIQEGTQQVETGAQQVGNGIQDTAEGIGKTVVGGAEVAGERLKEAGDAAGPQAKTAWVRIRDGAVAFGQSVKNFFGRLFGNSDLQPEPERGPDRSSS